MALCKYIYFFPYGARLVWLQTDIPPPPAGSLVLLVSLTYFAVVVLIVVVVVVVDVVVTVISSKNKSNTFKFETFLDFPIFV